MAKNHNNDTNEKKIQNNFIPKKVYVPIIVLLIYIISLFVPVVSAYSKYPIYIAHCGKLPLIASGYSKVYYSPGEELYIVTPFTKDFFCNPQQAESAGYHANNDVIK